MLSAIVEGSRHRWKVSQDVLSLSVLWAACAVSV